MAKKDSSIADLMTAMKKNNVDSADAAATDAVMIKGSMDALNTSFGTAFTGKIDSLISEKTPGEHSDLLDQIRRGVDGMKLSIGQRISRFVTNFAGLFPNRTARKAAHAAALATSLQQADTADIADTGRGIINELRAQSGLSKISENNSKRRADAIWGAKGFFSKNMSRVGSAVGWLTGKGGAGKEQENEERRHKSKHITLLEAILEALGGKEKKDDDDGGGGKTKWGRWALAAKRLATIAGIIIGIALAPFVFFGNFAKQLWTETKVIGKWVTKAAKWGKGTFFDPIKNAFNRIMKVGTWADDFKKTFNTKWNAFKARFTSSSFMQIFNRFRMRMNAIKINMFASIKTSFEAFKKTKVISGLMGTIGRFGTRLGEIKTTLNSSLGRAVRAFNRSKVITTLTGTFSHLTTSYNNLSARLTKAIEGAAKPRGPGGRFTARATNPFQALRSRFGVEQAKIVKRVAGWGKAFSNSPVIQKLGSMFNALKAPFIAVQEFLSGKKVARPAGMPPMLGGAPKASGGIMRVVKGFSSFFGTMGRFIKNIPGVAMITGPAGALGRLFGRLFWPLTAIFAIFDGVGQWKTDEGFTEETRPKTILGKIRASFTRAFANLIGMIPDMILGAFTWIMGKMGLGKESVMVAGRELKQDAPWMQKLKAFNFSEMLFGFIWKIGSIPGQIISFIGQLISDPVGTIKDIFNSQWVKDHIWDSGGGEGQPKRLFGIPLVMPSIPKITWPNWGQMFKDNIWDGGASGTKHSPSRPMRLFGIPLVFPSLSGITWPDWGQLFKDYIYDGEPEGGGIKIFGITLTFPSLSMPSWDDILPDWLSNPKEWFTGWFGGVKSFFSFGDKDKEPITEVEVDAKLTGIRESIASIEVTRKRLEAEWKNWQDKSAAGHSSGMSVGAYYTKEFVKNFNEAEHMKKMEQTRLEELQQGIKPTGLNGVSSSSSAMMVDGRQTHVTNVSVNASGGISDMSTVAGGVAARSY